MKRVFKCFLKQSTDSADLMGGGRSFQSLGARTEKEQSPFVLRLTRGKAKGFWLDDLRGHPVV